MKKDKYNKEFFLFKAVNMSKIKRDDFCWVEVKSNESKCVGNQLKKIKTQGAIDKILYRVSFNISNNGFKLENVLTTPRVDENKLDSIQRTIIKEQS